MHIQVVPYDPIWPAQFALEAQRIQAVLHSCNPVIEHVGSTAVPGLVAKPTLDMLVGLPDPENLDSAVFPLIGLGYIYVRVYEQVMPERRYLIRVENPTGEELPVIVDAEVNNPDRRAFAHTHHIHMVALDSPFWLQHLRFRDHLRTHAADREAYGALKRQLTTQDWPDGNAYNQAKAALIAEIEARAVTG
jgi:GrpB-like predicted nucleotidyltransferase (UPF0157 family)